MTKKTISLFNWELSHPVISAAGPFGANKQVLMKTLQSGAAAAITKTITHSPATQAGETIHLDQWTFNRQGYSLLPLKRWEEDLAEMRDEKIIANIYADTPAKLADLAVRMEKRGVGVLELGLSCPTFGTDPICCDPEKMYDFCLSVRRAVSIPIIVKVLMQMSVEANRTMASVIKAAGCDGICISDSLPGMFVKDDEGKPPFTGKGGLSGPMFKPLVLKALDDLKDSPLTKIACGGVRNVKDVSDYLQMGATAVEVCAYFLQEGFNGVKKLCNDAQYLTKQDQFAIKQTDFSIR